MTSSPWTFAPSVDLTETPKSRKGQTNDARTDRRCSSARLAGRPSNDSPSPAALPRKTFAEESAVAKREAPTPPPARARPVISLPCRRRIIIPRPPPLVSRIVRMIGGRRRTHLIDVEEDSPFAAGSAPAPRRRRSPLSIPGSSRHPGRLHPAPGRRRNGNGNGTGRRGGRTANG